jgi:ABC transporter substrate binding protein
MADPVGDELIVSLSRPGNITGATFLGAELIAKRFGLLKDAISGLSRVAALWHPAAYGKRTMDGMLKETETAALALGLQLQLVPAPGPGDLDATFVAMTRERADAVVLLPSPMLFVEHKCIVELAAKSRIPAMYAAREFVEGGGLMSYGASQPDLFQTRRHVCGQNPQGRQPGRSARGAADKAGVRPQSENGENWGSRLLANSCCWPTRSSSERRDAVLCMKPVAQMCLSRPSIKHRSANFLKVMDCRIRSDNDDTANERRLVVGAPFAFLRQ